MFSGLCVSAQGFDTWLHKYDIQPALSLDNRFTSLFGNNVTILGGKIGVDFEKKYHTGFGYYFLNTNLNIPYYAHDKNVTGKLNMYYFTYYFDLTLYEDKKWEVRMPIDIGYGHRFFNYSATDGLSRAESGELLLIEPSFSVTYRVWKWVGLAASVGERRVLLPAALNARGMSGPFAGIKVKIYLYDFYDDVLCKFFENRIALGD
jgi:hypothetical protein